MESDGFPEHFATELFTTEEWRMLSRELGLTARQREIARLICRGDSRVRIATRLRIAPDTVHAHTKEVFRKAGVKSRVGFVVRSVLINRANQARSCE